MKQSKIMIGYVETGKLPLLRDEDMKCLDVVNLAFGVVKNHAVIWDPQGHMDLLKHTKKVNPRLKLVLSVGGWGCGGFSEAAATGEGRDTLARTAVALVEQYQLDGLDIDWEYPCISISGIASSKEDKENFTLLLKRLRRELDTVTDRYCTLSIAAGADTYFIRCTQMKEVSGILDYVMLMTYDLRGGFSLQTGHHTNLYTGSGDLSMASTDYAVRLFEQAGVPAEKLVIGAAFYSRSWKGVPDRDHGFMQMAETIGDYGPVYSVLEEHYVNKNGYERHWDDEAKAPYLFNGSEFISYEDESSIRWKLNYVKEQNLAGIMFWEYSQDASHTLVPMMAKALREEKHIGKLV